MDFQSLIPIARKLWVPNDWGLLVVYVNLISVSFDVLNPMHLVVTTIFWE
jgi:hypothetical protein